MVTVILYLYAFIPYRASQKAKLGNEWVYFWLCIVVAGLKIVQILMAILHLICLWGGDFTVIN